MPTIEDARSELARLSAEGQAVIDLAFSESRNLSEEERAENEKRLARVETLTQLIDSRAKFAAVAVKENRPAAQPANGDAPGRAEHEAGNADIEVTEPDLMKFSDADKAQFRREAIAYLRDGTLNGPLQRRFATITTTSGSGLILPKAILPPLALAGANAYRDAHAYFGQSVFYTPGTGDFTLPILSGNNGGVVAENATTLNTTQGVTEGIRLMPKTYESGAALVSNLQLSANDFDLLDAMVPDMRRQKEDALESAISAAIIADSAVTQVVTTSSTSAFTYDNMVDLNRKLPKRYQSLKFIVMNGDGIGYAEKLKDGDGRPLLVLDPQNDQVRKFNGTPIFQSDYFEAFGASKVIGAVISLRGFRIRDAGTERVTKYVAQMVAPDQTGVNLYQYHGFGWAVAAVAKLKTPAS